MDKSGEKEIGRFMGFDEDYLLARSLVEETGQNVFLTGRAGTGKTTFLRELRQRGLKRMLVLAPTGIAAINAGGSTLHSFFQLPFGLYLPGYRRRNRFRLGKDKIELMQKMELMVIDEVSMLRSDLLDEVSGLLQRYRRDRRPFGGVQLLLIGDLQQLAPVVKEDEWAEMKNYYASPYFFDSTALKTAGFQIVELKHVYRQKDREFIGMLEKIRQGILDEDTWNKLSARYIPRFMPSSNEGYVILTTHNYQADKINDANVEALPGAFSVYQAKISGNFPESSFPTWQNLRFKPGAQVMFVKNDAGHRYYNGKIGRISRCEADEVWVESEGEEIRVAPEKWENMRYTIDPETKEIKETSEGSFSQLPLKLAWAITIHKSQGLTFDKVVVDAGRAFAHGQVYVALSRCRSLEGLVLRSPLTQEALAGDKQIEAFLRCADVGCDNWQLGKFKADYQFGLLVEQFDFSAIWKLFQDLRLLAAKFLLKQYPRLAEDIAASEDRFETEIYRVGENFFKELCRLRQADSEQQANRHQKAAVYFSNRLQEIVMPLLSRLKVETNAVVVTKKLEAIQSEMKRLYQEKLRTLALLADCPVFSPADYLRAKAGATEARGAVEDGRRG